MANSTPASANLVTLVNPSHLFGETAEFSQKAKRAVRTEVTRVTVPFSTIITAGVKSESGEQNFSADVAGFSGVDLSTQVIADRVDMHWVFRNGKVIESYFYVPVGGLTLAVQLECNGLMQKVGDTYNSVTDPEDILTIAELTLCELFKGRWNKQDEGAGAGAGTGIRGLSSELIEAVRRAFAVNREEFREEKAGRELAKKFLISKYHVVVEEADKVRALTGDAAVDEANAKKADLMLKRPFAGVEKTASVSRHLATIRREKAEASERAKHAALQHEVQSDLELEYIE